jgi:hypothetical protein
MEHSMKDHTREAMDAVREALPEFRQQDDYLLAHGASLMSEDSHEIVHVDTVRKIVEAALQWAASQQAAGFPPRMLEHLREVAKRDPSDNRGPWEYGDGSPMQDDADAALRWIAGSQQAAEGWTCPKCGVERSGPLIACMQTGCPSAPPATQGGSE